MVGIRPKESLPRSPESELLEAIRDTLEQPGVRRRFILAWIPIAGWSDSYARASARVSQWTNGDDGHHFPALALLTLARAAGHARFIDPVLAEETRVLREARADEARFGPMRSVRPREHGRESA